MKILHLSNVAGKHGGGISQVVHALLTYQIRLGINSILWFLGKKDQIDEVSNDYFINREKLHVIPKLFGLRFLISPIYFYNKQRFFKTVDIVHQHGVFLPISWISLMLNRNSKIIISPHGLLEPEKLKVSSIKKKIALKLFENKNLNGSHCLVACSKQEAIALRNFGLKQPIAILPNGVKKSFIKDNIYGKKNLSFKRKYNISPDTKILLFLSRVHPFKGLKLLLESILVIKNDFKENNWILVIAGPDELNHTSELRLFVKLNNLNNIVKFIGPQYKNDKINLFDSADCFILPTKGENFGIAILEALARGLPVITTKNTPWKILEDNQCGWVVKRNKNEFIRIILNLFLVKNSNLSRMGHNGINLVKNNYTWSKITNQTICLYNWVLNDYNEKFKKGFFLLEDY